MRTCSIDGTIFTDLLTEKDICERRNISVKILHVYLCLSSAEDLIICFVRVSSFYSYFHFIRISVLSLSMLSINMSSRRIS